MFGVAAYFMEENGFPVAPAILGVILGTMLEENFITSMIKSDGRFLGFFERPIARAQSSILIWLWRCCANAAGRPREPGLESHDPRSGPHHDPCTATFRP